MPRPTEQDIENARVRREIADRQAVEWQAAERLATEALGPGYTPWMKLVLLDADYHRTGDTTPVAVVYKVYRGEHETTEHSMFVRRMPDGMVRHAGSYEPLFGEQLTETHPTRTLDVFGQPVPAPRYSLCWSALERYTPQSAEALAAAREKREQKAVEREAAGNLFAEQILAEGYVPKRKGRPR